MILNGDSLIINTTSFDAATITELIPKKRKNTDVHIDAAPDSPSYIELAYIYFQKLFNTIPCRLQLPNKYNPGTLLPYLYKNLSLLNVSVEYDYSALFVDQDKKYILHVTFDTNAYGDDKCSVRFFYSVDVDVKHIIDTYKAHINDTRKRSKIGFFMKEYGDIIVKDFDLDVKDRKFDKLLYNKDFESSSEIFISKLNQQEAGLYLMYGDPGTGKSSFIRHLASVVGRRFVFVPPHMVDSVFSADYLSMLVGELKGAVLIVEDAEKVLLQRDAADGYHNSSTISSILNTTDGIYSDLTKLSIICTYNCDRNQIDNAFLRKGRLKYEYKFNALEVERAQALAKAYNIDIKIEQPMTIAEILNPDDNCSGEDLRVTERKFGFSA